MVAAQYQIPRTTVNSTLVVILSNGNITLQNHTDTKPYGYADSCDMGFLS